MPDIYTLPFFGTWRMAYGVENIVVVARAHACADHAEHGQEYKLRENHADSIGDDAEN